RRVRAGRAGGRNGYANVEAFKEEKDIYDMKVFKFGGASVKNAEGVRNIASIVGAEQERLFVVVSAMGKTTNALEGLLDTFYDGKTAAALERLQEIVNFHNRIIAELWGAPSLPRRVARFYM